MRIHPDDVIDAHVDMLDHMRPGSHMHAAVSAGQEDVAMSNALHDALRLAENYIVTAEMVDLVKHATEGLDTLDAMPRDLLPSPAGFLRAEVPFGLQDSDKDKSGTRLYPASWIVWGTLIVAGRPHLGVWWITDSDDESDQQRLPLAGRWRSVWAYIWSEDGVPMEASWGGGRMRVRPITKVSHQYGLNIRMTNALFSLLGQTITDVSDSEPSRRGRKTAGRRDLQHKTSVITLRRRKANKGDPSETHVEWHNRWVVNGHWRNQRYGTNREQVRRIWISPFIKGPEDAPLSDKSKVYVLRR